MTDVPADAKQAYYPALNPGSGTELYKGAILISGWVGALTIFKVIMAKLRFR